MTAGFLCIVYVYVGVLTPLVFLSYSSSLDPRQTEGAPLCRGTPIAPPILSSLPTVLMVGLGGTGYKGGKEADTKRRKKSFDMFYLTVSS